MNRGSQSKNKGSQIMNRGSQIMNNPIKKIRINKKKGRGVLRKKKD
ncbi:hypothetical protein M153_6040000306 [Pseudoloma neurophilia]|uniref:Uncharacterized protein n=1 Tax=Pseudoloma neurophilia TaxID=146866 RepID=A0A0R0LX09_9MICR|nr:hypothetical protein M153_6040000306 [Pseudoloma neurophilia]